MKHLHLSSILAGIVILSGCLSCENNKTDQPDFTIVGDVDRGPLFYYEGNNLKGIEYDILQAIAQTENLRLKFQPITSSENIFEYLDKKEKNAIFGINLNSDFVVQNLDCSFPYFVTSCAWGIRKEDSLSIRSINDLHGKRIATLKDSKMADYLDTHFKEAYQLDVFYADSLSEIMQQLLDKKVQACFTETHHLRFQLKKGMALKIIGRPYNEEYIGLAVSPGKNSDLIQKFNDGLAKISSNGTYDLILDKYLSSESPFYNVVIKFPHPPFSFVNEQGDTVGICSDLLLAISNGSNLRYRLHYLRSEDEIVKGLYDGLFDAALPIRNTDLLFPEPVFSMPFTKAALTMGVRHDNTDIHSVRDLKGKIVCVEKNTGISKLADQYASSILVDSVILRDTESEVYECVIDGIADACVVGKIDLTYRIRHEQLPLKTEGYFGETDLAIGFRKNSNQAIVSKINTEITNMTNDGTLNAILDKYNYSSYTSKE